VLASVGKCWKVLASVGKCWQVLASVGKCWQVLASVGKWWQVLASVEGISAEELIFTSRGCSKRETYAARSVGLRRSHDIWDSETGREEFDLKFWQRENLSEKNIFMSCVPSAVWKLIYKISSACTNSRALSHITNGKMIRVLVKKDVERGWFKDTDRELALGGGAEEN